MNEIILIKHAKLYFHGRCKLLLRCHLQCILTQFLVVGLRRSRVGEQVSLVSIFLTPQITATKMDVIYFLLLIALPSVSFFICGR